jgi:hypothetical protein
VVGGSPGAAGAFPAKGLNTSLITLARTVETRGGVAALGVVGCIMTPALGVTSVPDAVDTVVAVDAPATLGFDSKGLVEGVFTTASLAATVLLAAMLFVAAGEEPGEFAGTTADVDDDRPDPHVLCGVTSALVDLGAVSIGLDAVGATSSDDASDAGGSAVGVDW